MESGYILALLRRAFLFFFLSIFHKKDDRYIFSHFELSKLHFVLFMSTRVEKKKKRSLKQIIIHTTTATRVSNCAADSGWISVNFKLARQAPTQNSTVNPLLSQPMIQVWHIRGKVHSRILWSQHYYYHFFFHVFIFFMFSTQVESSSFILNSCKRLLL